MATLICPNCQAGWDSKQSKHCPRCGTKVGKFYGYSMAIRYRWSNQRQ